jgi:predicted RecA/RadA family phage recombinase
MSVKIRPIEVWGSITVTSDGAYDPGDPYFLDSGDVGVVMGLNSVASGDAVELMIQGIADAVAASATTFSAGASVDWDKNNETSIASTSGSDYARLGYAFEAKTSGQTVVRLKINATAPTP